MRRLMTDFGVTATQAAAVLGNIGHECNGFRTYHEIGQPVGRGGYGWAQWTGPRREKFFAWCSRQNLGWRSDEANYGYLKHELQTSEKGAITALRRESSLTDAVKAFEQHFERAGTPNYPSRNRWARLALDAFNAS